MATRVAYEQVVDQLRRAVPEFESHCRAHREEYQGQVFPHILFGDFTRFVLAAWDRGDRALVDRSLRFLETVLDVGDDHARGLVAVSFVENVAASAGESKDRHRGFVAAWPAGLRAEAERQASGESVLGQLDGSDPAQRRAT